MTQRSRLNYVTVASLVDAASWDEDAARLGGSAFHCQSWGAYRSVVSGGSPLYASWCTSDGETLALAVGVNRPVARGIRIVAFDAAPARGKDAPIDLVSSLVDWARTQATVEVRLGSFGSPGDGWGRQNTTDGRLELLVEPGSPDVLRRRMRKGARSSIARARRLGIQASLGEPSDIPEFVALYAITIDRLRTDRGVKMSLDEESLVDGLAILVGDGRGRLYLARDAGVAVCGCLFGCFGQSAYYLLNGSGEAARATGATAFLLHSALADLSAAGYVSLNLGGVSRSATSSESPDHGLYEFKLGLGGVPQACNAEQRLTIRPVVAAGIRMARALLRR